MTKQARSWTEALMATHLTQLPSIGSKLLAVPCCSWYGHEADLLVIEQGMRIVDIEIKVSRADFKADAAKDKWWRRRPWSRRATPPVRLEWPDKVWKHYYALPAELWTPELEACVSPASGIILVKQVGTFVQRRAKPNKDAKPISTADALDIARLTSLRYWALVRQGRILSDTNPGEPT